MVTFKVWVKVEACDRETGEAVEVQTPWGATAAFDGLGILRDHHARSERLETRMNRVMDAQDQRQGLKVFRYQ